ncbi:ScyD/ScyE family protein [Nocardioides solisilvae]|uniref:ScyD/ScyE family protein n=1 Tax=Nocardioides solisilvae TaxID=1542435 RepID=UPI0013A578B1|nr:ScyD/ScyE family protein [Nocardioides solisilvae]
MSRHGAIASSFALALLAAGLTVAPAQADDGDRAAAPKATTLAKGLLSPLSLAVSEDGTVYAAQNFAGMLMKIASGGKSVPVYQAKKKGTEVGAVSEHRGSLRFATTKGRKALLWGVGGSGKAVKLADLGAFEKKKNPDADVAYGFQGLDPACAAQIPEEIPAAYTGIVESHPYATAMRRGTTYVADAAGNDIVEVTPKGKVKALAVLPAVPVVVTAEIAAGSQMPACVVGKTYNFESVPTDVELGPDGKLYVSTLTGGPEDGSTGAQSKVYRINRKTGATKLVAEGLMSAVGLAVARNGDLYVSQLFPGQVSRIKKGSSVAKPWFSAKMTGDVEWSRRGLHLTTDVLPPEKGKPNGKVVHLR